MKRSTLASLAATGLLGFAAVTGLQTSDSGGALQLVGAIGASKKQPRHRWQLVRGRHWQIESSQHESTAASDAREGSRGVCAAGMVEVQGAMILEPDDNPFSRRRIATMQLELCQDWISKTYPERCRQFDRDRWLASIAELERKPMHFCIDRYEYPNVKGQYPVIFVSWHEARALCQEQQKRLCSEDEWTFACEGENAKPYPYGDGFVRDPAKCVSDQPWRAYNERAMHPRNAPAAGIELDRLWQGRASGDQSQCRSEFGVYDMTGNVDEWTVTVRAGERPSILKGGYWGPVRTRCRPTTRSHDENHTFYQQGFRCCADAPRGPASATSDAMTSSAPRRSPRL